MTATGRPSRARAAVAPSATSASRLHLRDLAFQPVQAGGGLALGRRLVDAALAAQLELEMLDRIGDVEPLARPAEFGHGAVEQLAGRARRRAGRAGLPGRPAARRPPSAPRRPALRRTPTAWRARRSGIRGSGRWPACSAACAAAAAASGVGCRAFGHRRSPRDRGVQRHDAARRPWWVRPRSSGRCAPWPRSAEARSAAASGRLRQYLRGISLRIIAELEPRGIEDAAVVGEPQRLAGVGRRRVVALRAGAEAAVAAVVPAQRSARASGWPSASA